MSFQGLPPVRVGAFALALAFAAFAPSSIHPVGQGQGGHFERDDRGQGRVERRGRGDETVQGMSRERLRPRIGPVMNEQIDRAMFSSDADRPPGTDRPFRGPWLPARCREDPAHDARYAVHARIDDEADRFHRGGHADRAGADEAVRSHRHLADRTEGHEGVSRAAQRRRHHHQRKRGARPADHGAGSLATPPASPMRDRSARRASSSS